MRHFLSEELERARSVDKRASGMAERVTLEIFMAAVAGQL
jgi:hypothetical protein